MKAWIFVPLSGWLAQNQIRLDADRLQIRARRFALTLAAVGPANPPNPKGKVGKGEDDDDSP